MTYLNQYLFKLANFRRTVVIISKHLQFFKQHFIHLEILPVYNKIKLFNRVKTIERVVQNIDIIKKSSEKMLFCFYKIFIAEKTKSITQ